MKIENAINAALSGQAILFAGSGFSHGAKNIFRSEERRVGKECGYRWSPGH